MNILKILSNQFLWLSLIVVIGFWVRLYRIENSVADWHSWRQADTAAVSRNFFKEGYNPFIPKYDDMSGVAQYPIPNPSRYRYVEFPIYNSLVYFAYLINGSVDERLARLVNVFISSGSTIILFFLVRRYFGIIIALTSSFLFALLPFNIYFSRVILPEPSLVFFCLGMLYFVDRWIYEDKKNLYYLSLFFTACAFLTKPQAAFYLLPLIYSYYQKEKKWWPILNRYYLLFIPAILPFVTWRLWMLQHPEGIPASSWLLNGTGIRLRPAFFRWIIGDRLGREILTAPGVFLFFVGLLLKPIKNEGYLLHLLALASFGYLVVFATGNVQHDYYQTLIVPALVIFTARGFVMLIKGVQNFIARIWVLPIASLFLILTIYLGWHEVRGLYQINNPVIVEAGKEADKILPKDAIVIAPYNGDTAFLYQVNRPGWAVVAYPIPELVERFGVTHYVSVNYDNKTNWVIRNYQVVEQTPKYTIVDLRKKVKEFNALDAEPM